jgi:quercetin dioxygenase-like cupin family protein
MKQNHINNERYDISDYTLEDGLTVSHTTLHVGQETRGHSHPNCEVYFFMTEAWVTTKHGDRIIDEKLVHIGESLLIEPGIWHRVSTIGNATASFYSVFIGERKQIAAVYGD